MYTLHTLASVQVESHFYASCNAEPSSLLRPPARLLRRHIMQRQLYTVYTRARAGREICANVVYNVPAPMYYIRAKEWCNKEAISRSLPSIPEVTTSCKSHACLCTMETHTRMLVSCYKCTAPYAILPSCAKNYIYKNDRAYFDCLFLSSLLKYSFFKFIFIFCYETYIKYMTPYVLSWLKQTYFI